MSAADVLGILGFALQMAGKLCDALQIIVDAPDEMEALLLEATRLRGLLTRIVETPIDCVPGRGDSSLEVLRLHPDLVEQARKLTGAASLFMETVTKVNGDGRRKVKRMVWLIHAAVAKNLAEEFGKLYSTVSAVYSIDTLAKVASIEPSIRATGDRTISAMGKQITHAVEHEITPAMERLLAAQEERFTHILAHQLSIVSRQQRDGHHQLFDELRLVHNNTEAIHGLPARPLLLTDCNEPLTPLSPPPELGPPTTNILTDTQTISTNVVSQSLRMTSLPEHVLPYSMPGPPRRWCSLDCQCRCHKRSNDYRPVPQALRSWIGDICIPERLMTSLTSARSCDDPQCMETRKTLSVVKWYLPEWFAQVHAQVTFQSIPVHFVIQTPRIVKSLRFVLELSFEELKMKLSTRELTVNDVEPDGRTVLHRIGYMIVHDRRSDAHEMMRYLIDTGAPQDWEHVGQTVTEYVTDMATRWYGSGLARVTHLRSFEYNVARPLLQEDMENAWERIRAKCCWSDLHYLVANPPSPPARLKADLARILTQPGAALHLNALDPYGRTPLLQAIHSCPEAVDALLRAGANPHLIDASLGEAVEAYSWRAIGPLVRAGADVNERYRRSNRIPSTALRDIIRIRSARGPGARLPCALELVRHAGHWLDWDVRDELGTGYLGWAEWRMDRHPSDEDVASIYKLYKTRRLPLSAQLIDRSCLSEDAEAAIRLESMSLTKAGLAGNVQVVGELIDAGVMVNERDAFGRTLLHLVAMGVVPNGYAVALELVRHGGYNGVYWDVLTVDGETAEDLAEETLKGLLASDIPSHEQREEASNILRLLQRCDLPEGMNYVYPCMHIDYCQACCARPCSGYCSNGLKMPGAFV